MKGPEGKFRRLAPVAAFASLLLPGDTSEIPNLPLAFGQERGPRAALVKVLDKIPHGEADPNLIVPEEEPEEMIGFDEIVNAIDCSIHNTHEGDEITDHQLLEILKCEEIENINMETGENHVTLTLTLANGKKLEKTIFISYAEYLQKYLMSKGIPMTLEEGGENVASRLLNIIIFSLLGTIIGITGIGLTRRRNVQTQTRSYLSQTQNIKFNDIGGLDSVKASLMALVTDIREREKLAAAGCEPPKGVLFTGPPGTGKTMAAQALANEVEAPFISISGGHILSKWFGESTRQIREVFQEARQIAEEEGVCIVFIDEIDSIGTKRDEDAVGVDKERTSIVNELLVSMDGVFQSQGLVVVVMATNHPESLDPALTRKGRVNRELHFTPPREKGRLEILRILTKEIELDPNVRLETFAAILVGHTGADIAELVEEAKRSASRRPGRIRLTQQDLTDAYQATILGIESDIIMSQEEAELVAAHEAGHAVMALNNKAVGLERVSIVPRGRALGVTVTPPIEEQTILTSSQAKEQIKMLLAGRVAEELLHSVQSSAAADDIEQATIRARQMVLRWGMAPPANLFPLRRYEDGSDMEGVHQAIATILGNCRDDALTTLKASEPLLRALAQALIEQKTLEHADIIRIVERPERSQ